MLKVVEYLRVAFVLEADVSCRIRPCLLEQNLLHVRVGDFGFLDIAELHIRDSVGRKNKLVYISPPFGLHYSYVISRLAICLEEHIFVGLLASSDVLWNSIFQLRDHQLHSSVAVIVLGDKKAAVYLMD